jgi:hypothetical protein
MVKPRHAVRHDQAGAVFDEHMALIAYSGAKHGDSSVKTMSTLCASAATDGPEALGLRARRHSTSPLRLIGTLHARLLEESYAIVFEPSP